MKKRIVLLLLPILLGGCSTMSALWGADEQNEPSSAVSVPVVVPQRGPIVTAGGSEVGTARALSRRAAEGDYIFRRSTAAASNNDDLGDERGGALVNGALGPGQADGLRLRIHALTEQLLSGAAERVAGEYRVVVTTFVNLGRLYRTSSFGRVVSEMMIDDLRGAGVEVIDVRMAASLQIMEGFGEYGLSRDMDQLSYVHDAQAVVVGTYSFQEGEVMINARLLERNSGLVLSSSSLSLPGERLIVALLRDEATPHGPGIRLRIQNFDEIETGEATALPLADGEEHE